MNAKQIYKAMVNIANDYVGMGREKQAGDSAVLDTIMRVYYTDEFIDFEEVKWLWVCYLTIGKLDFPTAKRRARERVEQEKSENDWIPVSSGSFPDDMEDVQVTYIGLFDEKPHCDLFAYRKGCRWYWTDSGCESKVKITAWKKRCEPYAERE